MTNSLFLISPYKFNGIWVFDDPTVGLVREALIAGIDTMLDILTQDIPGASEGFNLMFSENPFPGYQVQLRWLCAEENPEMGGNWYYCYQFKMDGWLCPALYKYFTEAPTNIYIKASAISHSGDSGC